MTLRHLSIFLAVAEYNSMQKAAEHLYITQPTVSQAISSLEKHYGVQLFERLGKKLYITPKGQELFSYAAQILQIYDEMERNLVRTDRKIPLRIGCSATIDASSLFDHLLNLFEKKYPSYTPMVTIDNTPSLENLLSVNQIDIALTEGTGHNTDLVRIPVFKDQLLLVASREYPFKHGIPKTILDLNEENFVMREHTSKMWENIHRAEQDFNLSFTICWTSRDLLSMKRAILNKRGIGLMSSLLIRQELAQHSLIVLDIPELSHTRHYYIVHHKNKYITPPIQNFTNLCTTCFGDMESSSDSVTASIKHDPSRE